jgi:tRNA (cytidine56-2'-O)-methyltransferase
LISVLRIGHRIERDKRITTHVALVARAFGADKILISTKDVKLEKVVNSICKNFGGDFEIKSGVNQKELITHWKGIIVHLTMYGYELNNSISKIDKEKDILIIVGSEKVPAYIYDLADYNISIGNQPHSEVSSLAIFLDRYTKGRWLSKNFEGKIQIIPSDKGKIVKSNRN